LSNFGAGTTPGSLALIESVGGAPGMVRWVQWRAM
jgi:hypothetical protein